MALDLEIVISANPQAALIDPLALPQLRP